MRARYLGDQDFHNTMLHVAVPIALQSLIFNVLSAVDMLMFGQLGDTAVAAAGLANQFYLIMSYVLFGVGSGAVIFASQFWGRADLAGYRRVLGLALMIATCLSTLFTLAACLAPATLLGLYSRDPGVIAAGSRYLQVAGLSYIPTAISTTFGMVLRSARQVRVPMAVSIGALSFKGVLAYCLIFGFAGLPKMGIVGAAVALCCGRLLECAVLLWITYRYQLPAAARLSEMFVIDRELAGRFAHTALPVVLGELIWSLGGTTYTGVYAHIGTESVAATNIAATIENIALVPFLAISSACAVILGNCIGAGDTSKAAHYGRQAIVLAVVVALAVGAIILVISQPLLTLVRISAEAQFYTSRVLAVLACSLWLKASNITMMVGILRGGGDTRFALLADAGPLWLIGVPMAFIGAFILHLPVYWVGVLILADEAIKFWIAMWRVRSGRWINNVVRTA